MACPLAIRALFDVDVINVMGVYSTRFNKSLSLFTCQLCGRFAK